MKPLTIWMWLDEESCISYHEQAEEHNSALAPGEPEVEARDFEYAEIEKSLQSAMPGRVLRFTRNVLPSELRGPVPDIYIWDIGGMCKFDWNGERRVLFNQNVVRKAQEYLDVIFVPYSQMTLRDVKYVMEVPDPDDGDCADNDSVGPSPNILLYTGDFLCRDSAAEMIAKYLSTH